MTETLSRAHALFAAAPDSAARMAQTAGAGLATAADLVRYGRTRMGTLTGSLPAAYGDRASDAAGALDDAAGADRALGDGLDLSATADRDGRVHSGAVLRGANADAAVLAPESGTAAGQRTLVIALRQRVAEQQRILELYRERGARLAAIIRGLSYQPRRSSSGIPWRGTPFGANGAPRGLPPARLPDVGGSLAALARERRPALPDPGHAIDAVLGSLSRDSTPRDVAAAIIGEARRRGYSPRQSIAILATAIQESGLRPRAVSPNGLWESIFQQDSSYPGRRDPNRAITGFFDRLGVHGGPAAPDIWKAIFWLQQRPGEPTAATAYAHGRQGYLSEIMNQRDPAAALYRDITGGVGV
ncbi:hypothetical protein [Mycolicibacterium llatzerense]|uniref:hypothetical protein n=1 Tax=Mycolicibacterium llatzerense TaxID=280871 RepID=UPI0013A6C2F5|nr:hypothetical protein [Mycolicibacterium llatzerense]